MKSSVPVLCARVVALGLIAVTLATAGVARAHVCPEKSLIYWQAFPAGGESDLSARHQQAVLKRLCPGIDAIVQYKPGAGGGVMWAQMNALPGDGLNIVGVNLPHIFLQPLEGQVQYKTSDVTPVYWFHYTPDAIIVLQSSVIKNYHDLVTMARSQGAKMSLAGSGLNSANHAASERFNQLIAAKTTYVPFKGTGDMTAAVLGAHVTGAMSYTAFAISNKERVRALAVASARRHPLLPDTPTFRELGVDWVDGAYRGIGVPKSTPLQARKRLSDLWAALNADPEMRALAEKSGFELVDIGVERMDAFMQERAKHYSDTARRLGLGN